MLTSARDHRIRDVRARKANTLMGGCYVETDYWNYADAARIGLRLGRILRRHLHLVPAGNTWGTKGPIMPSRVFAPVTLGLVAGICWLIHNLSTMHWEALTSTSGLLGFIAFTLQATGIVFLGVFLQFLLEAAQARRDRLGA
jgi:hypothetical protein